MRSYRRGGDSIFAAKIGLKINRSVKAPWHGPSMEVARSGLWAADSVIIDFRHFYTLVVHKWFRRKDLVYP